MKNHISVNFLRLFYNRKFYYCILGMTTSLYFSGLSYIRTFGSSANFNDCLAVTTSSGFILLYYVLCVIGGGLDYCEDCKNHYTKYLVIRKGIIPYAKGKFFSAAFSGFFSMLISFLFFELLMIVTFGIQKGSFSEILSQNTTYAIQNQWDLLIFSLLGTVFSVFALLITTFIPNIFVGSTMPILVYYMIVTLTNKYGSFRPLLPSCVYFGFSELFQSRAVHFLYALCYTGCILYICFLILKNQMKRRLQNA